MALMERRYLFIFAVSLLCDPFGFVELSLQELQLLLVLLSSVLDHLHPSVGSTDRGREGEGRSCSSVSAPNRS